MNCSTYCLKCTQPQVIKANFCAHHGLCAEHYIGSTLSKCIHCGSIVPIISKPEKKPCTICGSPLESNYSRCQHLICDKCADFACPACNNICDYCGNNARYLKHCAYAHLLCFDCLQKNNNLCPVCNIDNSDMPQGFGECEYCLKVSKVLEKPCKHALCVNCDAENLSCPLCVKEKSVSKKNEKSQAVGVGISSADVQASIKEHEMKGRKDSQEFQRSDKVDIDFNEVSSEPREFVKIPDQGNFEKKEGSGKDSEKDLSVDDRDVEDKREGRGSVKIINQGYKEIAGTEQLKSENYSVVKNISIKSEGTDYRIEERLSSEKDPLLSQSNFDITEDKGKKYIESYQIEEKIIQKNTLGLLHRILLVVGYIFIIGPLISLMILAFCYEYSSKQLRSAKGTCATILCIDCCDPGSPAQSYWIKLMLCKCSSKKRS